MHSIIGRAVSGQHNVMQCIDQSIYCMNLYCNEYYMDNIRGGGGGRGGLGVRAMIAKQRQ